MSIIDAITGFKNYSLKKKNAIMDAITVFKNYPLKKENAIKVQKVVFPYFILCDKFEVHLIMSPSMEIRFPIYFSFNHYKKISENCEICTPKTISGPRLMYPFRLSSKTFANVKIGKVKFDDGKEESNVIRYNSEDGDKVCLVSLNTGEIPLDGCTFIESDEAWDLT